MKDLSVNEQQIWNAALDAAAMTARVYGPPNWSWSESSLIIKDTCHEISDAILNLKRPSSTDADT